MLGFVACWGSPRLSLPGARGLPGAGLPRAGFPSGAPGLACAVVTTPPSHPIDVLLILNDADRLLLALREGTGYADGQWNLPSGKLEIGEDAVSAVIREAREELGVELAPQALNLVAVVHHRNARGDARVGLTFRAAFDPLRHRPPHNAEPHKCAGLRWFHAADLPANTYPYTVACVRAYRDGELLRLSGW